MVDFSELDLWTRPDDIFFDWEFGSGFVVNVGSVKAYVPAGREYELETGWSRTFRERRWHHLLFFLFGVPIFLCVLVYQLVRYVDEEFQVWFFVCYTFGGWRNMGADELEKVNGVAAKSRTSTSRRDRIFRYCVGLINRRNGYEHG